MVYDKQNQSFLLDLYFLLHSTSFIIVYDKDEEAAEASLVLCV